ncbi:hypothetical protein ABW21_db0209267 [Orbilia brochopaga]|nr:hypothetical protein ABW21_db0209267 [Drechslerella brochopaga]
MVSRCRERVELKVDDEVKSRLQPWPSDGLKFLVSLSSAQHHSLNRSQPTALVLAEQTATRTRTLDTRQTRTRGRRWRIRIRPAGGSRTGTETMRAERPRRLLSGNPRGAGMRTLAGPSSKRAVEAVRMLLSGKQATSLPQPCLETEAYDMYEVRNAEYRRWWQTARHVAEQKISARRR